LRQSCAQTAPPPRPSCCTAPAHPMCAAPTPNCCLSTAGASMPNLWSTSTKLLSATSACMPTMCTPPAPSCCDHGRQVLGCICWWQCRLSWCRCHAREVHGHPFRAKHLRCQSAAADNVFMLHGFNGLAPLATLFATPTTACGDLGSTASQLTSSLVFTKRHYGDNGNCMDLTGAPGTVAANAVKFTSSDTGQYKVFSNGDSTKSKPPQKIGTLELVTALAKNSPAQVGHCLVS